MSNDTQTPNAYVRLFSSSYTVRSITYFIGMTLGDWLINGFIGSTLVYIFFAVLFIKDLKKEMTENVEMKKSFDEAKNELEDMKRQVDGNPRSPSDQGSIPPRPDTTVMPPVPPSFSPTNFSPSSTETKSDEDVPFTPGS